MARRVTVIVEGREYVVEVGDLGERPIKAVIKGKTYEVHLTDRTEKPGAVEITPASEERETASRKFVPASDGTVITAPMPGDIAEIRVKAGDLVKAGDVVCVLEAMKMKNLIHTAQDGVVASVEVAAGQAVEFGAVLITLAASG